jgi:hypothetical protein
MNYLEKLKTVLSNDKIWFWLGILLSAGFVLIIFSDIGDTSLTWMYTNADKIYSPIIFQDIFIDGTGVRGWHLNGAPNFFPDIFCYFILMSVLREPLVTDFAFSMLQYMGFLFLIFWLFRQIDKEKSMRYTTFFIYLMFFYLLIPVFQNRFLVTFQLLSISFHFGATIMTLLSLNFFIMYLRQRKKGALIALIIFTFLGALSDRLFLVQLLFPVLTLLVLFFNKTHRKKLLIPVAAVLLSSIAGLYMFRLVVVTKLLTIVGTGFKMFNFENIGNSWVNLMHHMKGMLVNFHAERGFITIAIIAFLAAVFYLLKNIKPIFRGEGEPSDRLKYYLLIYIVVFMPMVFLMPVINGAYVGRAIIRFNFMALVMGSVLLPMLIMSWEKIEKIVTKILVYLLPLTSLVFVVLFIVRVANAELIAGLGHYFNFYPPRSQILDELKDTHDLKYGVGNYWHAKYATLYSQNGTRLYAVGDKYFKPSYHTTNENWYHSGGKGKHKDPVFNYLTIDGFNDTEKLVDVFGDKMDTIYHDKELDIIVVKVPEFVYERGTGAMLLLDKVKQIDEVDGKDIDSEDGMDGEDGEDGEGGEDGMDGMDGEGGEGGEDLQNQ